VREAAEESGLRVRLLAAPSLALPRGYPHERVAAPWWITEVLVPADNHVSASHVPVDHQWGLCKRQKRSQEAVRGDRR
jgi:hypothetical protein